jgi:ring-1,2-phenylacetyl-CoA epoxidase subunit PaaD
MVTVAAPLGRERIEHAWAVLATVLDPEVPALSVCDLGMVRAVHEGSGTLEVTLTPTYSGCPATEMIEAQVLAALEQAGLSPVQVRWQRTPAWSSDWISSEGRRKLQAYGIAPPGAAAALPQSAPIRWRRRSSTTVPCPHCGSAETTELSAFGSTACKALYRCLSCREPFEYFKPI